MPISSILVALGKIPDAELAALTVSRAMRAAEVPAGLRFSLSRRLEKEFWDVWPRMGLQAQVHFYGEREGFAGALEDSASHTLLLTVEYDFGPKWDQELLRRFAKTARREALLPWRPAAETLAERRAAIRALLCIDGDSLTLAAVNRAIQGCGIRAQVRETGVGTVEVWFPGQQGVPAQFERIRRILLDLLPCHLAVTFCFRYLSWEEFEGRSLSWAAVEAAGTTWEGLELSSTREDGE